MGKALKIAPVYYVGCLSSCIIYVWLWIWGVQILGFGVKLFGICGVKKFGIEDLRGKNIGIW